MCGFYFSFFLFCSVSCLCCVPGSINLTEEAAEIVGAAGIAMTGVVIPGCSQLAFVLPLVCSVKSSCKSMAICNPLQFLNLLRVVPGFLCGELNFGICNLHIVQVQESKVLPGLYLCATFTKVETLLHKIKQV